MKVLVIHNRYRSSAPSGEDMACDAEAALLAGRGSEVVRYERANDDIVNPLAAAFEMIWSRQARNEIAAVLRRERPDVAHVHNLWYRISPSAYAACRDAGVPVVQTLHNFRIFCANALLLRDGRPCEACVTGSPWPALRHGCYRESRPATAAVAFAQRLHAARGTWFSGVDRFIALTEFARERFVAAGLPRERICVKPNFLADPPLPKQRAGAGMVFAGRLTREKGVLVLLEAAGLVGHRDFGLEIIGDGALLGNVERSVARSGGRVRSSGARSRAYCLDAMRRALFVVVPSCCYENFPLAIVEAFACGTPVVAARLGAMAELVDDGRTGRLFVSGDAVGLAATITWMLDHPAECAEMGRAARKVFDERYTADRNHEQLQEIYRQASGRNPAERTPPR
jgi:glycosyltransferase involved in cell wall biosynthesis